MSHYLYLSVQYSSDPLLSELGGIISQYRLLFLSSLTDSTSHEQAARYHSDSLDPFIYLSIISDGGLKEGLETS